MDLDKAVRRADRIQQRWPWMAYPFAVVKKFGDDHAGDLAALLLALGLAVLVTGFLSGLGGAGRCPYRCASVPRPGPP